MKVRLGRGVVQLLQLDDDGSCREIGIEWSYATKTRIEVVGDESAMLKLRQACVGAEWFVGEIWYPRCARAAITAIDAALAARNQ